MTCREITGSKVHRLWKCPASAELPGVINDTEEARTEPARNRGKDIHKFLETVREIGIDAALAAAPKDLRLMLSCIDLDRLPAEVTCEVAFAWNCQTGGARVLGRGLNRGYGGVADPPVWPEIPITIDVAGIYHDAVRGICDDYKSGHTKYPTPDQWGQTMLGALCIQRIYGVDEVEVSLTYIHDDGDHHSVRRVVDSWDLDAFDLELRAAFVLAEGYRDDLQAGRLVPLREGAHCDYCPAYLNCRAKTEMLRSVPAELVAMGVGPLDPEGKLAFDAKAITIRNAADVFMMAERIEEALARVKQEICNISAVAGPIPLADGRIIERVERKWRTVDPKIAYQVMERRYGAERAMTAFELKTSFSALREVVAANKGPKDKMETRKGDGVFDAVTLEITKIGGVSINTSEAFKPHQPKKKALGSGGE